MAHVAYEACPACRKKGRDRRGDNLGRYPDGSGHCFSCGHHEFPKGYVKKEKESGYENKAVLPYDFSREVPARGWKWLLQYGLPYTYWRPYVGWSEHYQRLIFTVGSPVRFSQGRLLPELQPRALQLDSGTAALHLASGVGGLREGSRAVSVGSGGQPSGGYVGTGTGSQGAVHEETLQSDGVGGTGGHSRRHQSLLRQQRVGKPKERKWLFFGDGHGYVDVLEPKERSVDEVVLVEDLISAHKVGQVATCFSLFGTNIHDLAIKKLMALKRPVTLWLDWDQAGLLAPKLNRLQSLLNVPARHIWKGKDPKEYSLEDIRNILTQ